MIFPRLSRWWLLLLLGVWGNVQAQTWRLDADSLPAVPRVQTSVYDYAHILSGPAREALEQKLIRYADTTGTQIVVAIVPRLPADNINFWGANWAHKWGIGQEDADNGILIIVAPVERKTAIITGYGVEDRLTDALSRRIIERIMIPHFRKGDYAGGLNRAADVIFSVLQGKFKAPAREAEDQIPWGTVIIILLIFFLILWLASRHRGGGGDGGYTIDRPGPVFWGGGFGGGSSGGFGGGSFGGGFSGGFGGGGFGGGGASGSW